MKSILRYLVIIFLLIVFKQEGSCNSITSVVDKEWIKDYDYEMLLDSTGKITLNDIVNENNLSFCKIPSPCLNISRNKSTFYWVRFKLKNLSKGKSLVLQFPRNYNSAVIYYKIEDQYLQGNSLNHASGFFKTAKITYEIPYIQGETEIIARVKIDFSTGIGFYIYSLETFLPLEREEITFFSFLLGLLVIILIYNVVLFFVVHERLYLFYACYLIFFISYSIIDFGYLQVYFPFINYNHNFYFVAFSGITLSLILYTKAFFDLERDYPKLNKILLFAFFARLATFFLYMVGIDIFKHIYIDNFFHTVVFICAFIAFKKKIKYSRYFMVAYTLLYISFILHAAYLEFEVFYDYHNSLFYGLACSEIILFSIAISSRLQNSKKEKEEAQEKTIEQLRKNSQLKEEINEKLSHEVEKRTQELKQAYQQINIMNAILKKENIELHSNVNKLEKARVMQKTVTFDEFKNIFPDETACFKYLHEMKIKKEKEYMCRKCGNNSFSLLSESFIRKCNKCSYKESPTVGTIFYNIKFPLEKAFYILFLVSSGKNVTDVSLSEMVSLRRGTCGIFKQKVLESIASSEVKKKKNQKGWEDYIIESKSII